VPPEALSAFLAALNEEPSVHLRARPPGTRDEVIQALAAEGIGVEPSSLGEDALRVAEVGGRVFESAPFKRGRLQVQDLGSQLIVAACRPERGFSGATVADLCAGAGGKAIALADFVGPSGRVFASDASRKRLEPARRRARELGVGRVVSFPTPVPLTEADVVLIDAPCSGTGSFARDPAQKWQLTPKRLEALLETQRELLDDAAARMAPGAVLVYATCSVLTEENEAQVEALLARTPTLARDDVTPLLPAPCAAHVMNGALRLLPHRAAGGGFFAARLRRVR
jgi:16S rRNA (cytosine967-C5)-methyltransferase